MTTPIATIVTLDPRDESNPGLAMLAPRDTTLDGKVVGLFSNNKPHSVELLRMIADVMRERYSIKGVVEHNKGGQFRRLTLEMLPSSCKPRPKLTGKKLAPTICCGCLEIGGSPFSRHQRLNGNRHSRRPKSDYQSKIALLYSLETILQPGGDYARPDLDVRHGRRVAQGTTTNHRCD